jgi:hypothetical protein
MSDLRSAAGKVAFVVGTVVVVAVGSVMAAGVFGAVSGYWSVEVEPGAIDATTFVRTGLTDGPVAADINASAAPLLLPACNSCGTTGNEEKAVRLDFQADSAVCYSLDRAVTLSAAPLRLSDGNSVCFAGNDGLSIVDRPNWALLIQTEHGRQHRGICSSPITVGSDALFAPCDANDDCADFVIGATCTAFASTTSVQQQNVGVYLIHGNPSTVNVTKTLVRASGGVAQ